jgi:GNAT superfamily N-acetyltransferase
MPDSVVPVVRQADTSDASLLAELGRRTFLGAFREVVAPDDMEAYLLDAFTETRTAEELADPSIVYLVASVDDRPAGYAKLHFGALHPSVTGCGAVKLWRLYSDQAWYGRGIGSALLRSSLRCAWERGGQTMWLTVNAGNQRAIRFYEKSGFTVVGSATFLLGAAIHDDHVMARALSPADGTP